MNTLLDPAILFFVLGITAGLLKSNLDIPAPLSRFLSLYLLMALGLKGGFALSKSGLSSEVLSSLGSAITMALIVPAFSWLLLRRLLPPFDAIGVAATYGSVSAVTFVTATQVLEQQGTPAGGHMAAAMALMESPAILISVGMAGLLRLRRGAGEVAVVPQSGGAAVLTGPQPVPSLQMSRVMREALTDGSTLLLLGALAVGLITGSPGEAAMKPFAGDLFKGLLAFFLLDMGLLTARHLPGLRGFTPALLAYAVCAPVVHALMALVLARLTGMSIADATLLAVLAASASYIAVPAVLRHAVPEAQPALYFGLSLGLTFPFNLLLGIPLYQQMATLLFVPK